MALTAIAAQSGRVALLIGLNIGLGGLPLVGWINRIAADKKLSQRGTGNVSVAATFQQAGVPAGIVAVLSEAAKGIAAVCLARWLLPAAPFWELIALMALVAGRYFYGGSAGSTNAFWGLLVHTPMVTALTAALGGLGYALVRRPRFWQYAVLPIFCGGIAIRYPDQPGRIGGAIALSLLLAWIYRQLPNDVTRKDPLKVLDQPLAAEVVGQKAATLSTLKRAGYPVAAGWVLPKGDERRSLLEVLQPTEVAPLIVRSSAVGEDQEGASAAGQYETIANVTNLDQLREAISRCFASYDAPAAVRYRQDRDLTGSAMAALIQRQVAGQFSGVAFSRDPIAQQPQVVLVEGLPGGADQVVSGEVTPEQYRVTVTSEAITNQGTVGQMPTSFDLPVEGEGEVPQHVVQQVAYLARQVERHYHGVPQDIEWSYDGDRLWLLQARPITTLLPIWTRKIASEVLPGIIQPLTWSINQPLTCGVWGDIFTVMLGDRATDLDFDQTATLHYSRTYFNASLLGRIFTRLGLPPESLEFLTLGESFSPPALPTLIRNLPGLGRLVQREWQLEQHFQQADRDCFTPELQQLSQQTLTDWSLADLQQRIETILAVLAKATYYNILAPLSESIRQALLPVSEAALDYTQTPEVAALRSLQALAFETRQQLKSTDALPDLQAVLATDDPEELLAMLAQSPEGKALLERLDDIVQKYGYLSESATDIAVPTWREQPQPAHRLFIQFVQQPARSESAPSQPGWLAQQVQRRLRLKGQVATVYNRLLAELRRSFLTLAGRWHQAGHLSEPDDIFFLTWDEVQADIQSSADWVTLQKCIQQRRVELAAYQDLPEVPAIVYGRQAPDPEALKPTVTDSVTQLQGIGASAGQAEGHIKIVRDWQNLPSIDRDTILAVPYTDAGWAPLLAQAGGLISEAGGRLSHGAIVAREYGIPAVMNLSQATQRLQDGQRVRIHGQSGRVELLEEEPEA